MHEPLEPLPELDPEDIVRAILDATHTYEPHTNAEKLARYVGLTVKGFDHREYHLDFSIRAFLWPAKHLIGIDRKLTNARRTFSILHEVGHYVLPGHVTLDDKMILDEAKTLSSTTLIKQEMEANKFASDCIFQLDHFDKFISDKNLNWKNIRSAADNYGASFEATARRWVERTPETYGLIAMNPINSSSNAPLSVMYTVTSPAFARQFFSRLPTGQTFPEDSLVHRIFHRIEFHDDPTQELIITIGGKTQKFTLQLFSNQYRMFGLIVP